MCSCSNFLKIKETILSKFRRRVSAKRKEPTSVKNYFTRKLLNTHKSSFSKDAKTKVEK